MRRERIFAGQATHRVVLTLMLAAALAGCTGSLLDTKLPVPTTYVLAAAPAGAASADTAPAADLAVSRAQPAPGLNTERIAVLHEGRRLDYFLDSQWGAALPQVAQAMVVGSLQNQKWFRSVTSEQARVNTHYWLELEVRDFQAEYASEGAMPTVRVTFVGSLVRIKDRKLLGVYPATVSVPATENRLAMVVAAFESAAQQASLSIGKQVAGAMKSE